RNDLVGLFLTLQYRGKFTYGNHQIDYGVKYAHEDIRDRVREFQIIDSTGFSLRPPIADLPNRQPYEPFEGEIIPYTHTRAKNHTKIDRLENFIQWSYQTNLGENKAWVNAGVRSHTWTVSGENIKSITQT